MRDMVFFAALLLYFAAMIVQIVSAALGRQKGCRAACALLSAGLALHTVYSVWRGIAAGRLPLANQFEFASGFAWAIAVLGLILHARLRQT